MTLVLHRPLPPALSGGGAAFLRSCSAIPRNAPSSGPRVQAEFLSETRGSKGLSEASQRSQGARKQLAAFLICRAGSETGPGGAGQSGDEHVQDLLTDMIRLQSGRAQVESFAAEKAQELQEVMTGACQDLERIAEAANDSLATANAKTLEDMDSQVGELEKILEASRKEQEKRDKEFEEFERQLVEKQNAGLFFKSLYRSTKPQPKPTKEEVLKNTDLSSATKAAARSPMRRNLYGVFAFLAGLTLSKAISDGAPLASILACSAILVALVFQVVYELSLAESE